MIATTMLPWRALDRRSSSSQGIRYFACRPRQHFGLPRAQEGYLQPRALSALTAAQQLGGDIDALVVGSEAEASDVAEKAAK